MWREGSKGRKENKLKDTLLSKTPQWLGTNLVKKQKEFRKIFEFPEDEEIVASTLVLPNETGLFDLLSIAPPVQGFNCSLKASAGGVIENMVQGTMYITPKHICFYSNFWGTERKVRVGQACGPCGLCLS